jgi:hypothetical protein
VVAPQEADFQAVKARPEKNPTVVTGDSDIIAYGSRKTIVMKKWSMTREEYRIISFVNVSTTQAESLPLYRAYLAFGLDVFAVWAACNGCDFSKGDTRIGVEHIGPAALIQVFTALMESNTDGLLDLHRVAESLIEAARTTPLVSPGELAWELQRIVEWYRNGGRFYDISNGNEYRGHEKKLICEANAFSNEHMRGKRDSGTKEPFSRRQQELLDSYIPSNALHNSVAAGIDARALRQPGVLLDSLKALELKQMIAARGGNLTDQSGKALTVQQMKKLCACYEKVEQEVQTSQRVFYDRNPSTNGVFSKINTNHGASVLAIVQSLCNDPRVGGLSAHHLLERVRSLLREKLFVDDINQSALEAPELPEDVVYMAFTHIGMSTGQKNLGVSFQRTLDSDLLRHANADVREDCLRFLYVLSKQQASYTKDQKTRKDIFGSDEVLGAANNNLKGRSHAWHHYKFGRRLLCSMQSRGLWKMHSCC